MQSDGRYGSVQNDPTVSAVIVTLRLGTWRKFATRLHENSNQKLFSSLCLDHETVARECQNLMNKI